MAMMTLIGAAPRCARATLPSLPLCARLVCCCQRQTPANSLQYYVSFHTHNTQSLPCPIRVCHLDLSPHSLTLHNNIPTKPQHTVRSTIANPFNLPCQLLNLRLAPINMSQPLPSHSRDQELVQVDTALAVLSRVNLLAESNALALDIGGSLAKLLYLQPYGTHTTSPPLVIHRVSAMPTTALSVHVPQLRGTLHFFAFETRNIHELLRFIRQHWVNTADQNQSHTLIRATGGGSFKFDATFSDQIGVKLAHLDEMACTVAGLNFLLTTVQKEVYVVSAQQQRVTPPISPLAASRNFVKTNKHPFPYLLVNIGSGVSIVKVTDHAVFERVSGSSLGGGTFWGLARMLLDCSTFDQVIELTKEGDNKNVDMLVGDIYGGSYANLGLDSSVIAASFGKSTMRKDYSRTQTSSLSMLKDRLIRAISGTLELWIAVLLAVPLIGTVLQLLGLSDGLRKPTVSTYIGAQYRPQDIALSLLRMVSYNIGQIAYLNARVHNLHRIYFGGNFIRNHPYTLTDISYAVDFWSQGEMQALFLKHDGYLGAIGAFIGASSASPDKIIEEIYARKQKDDSVSHPKTAKPVVADETPSHTPNGHLEEPPVERRMNGTAAEHAAVNDQPKTKSASRKRRSKKAKADSAVKPVQQDDTSPIKADINGVPDVDEHVTEPSSQANSENGWTTVSRIRRRSTTTEKHS